MISIFTSALSASPSTPNANLTAKSPSADSQLPSTSTSSSDPNSAATDDIDNVDDIDEVDDQGQSILMGIISQLRPGCDLSRITLPTFILERKSMLERITNQLQQPDILLKANSTQDPTERFLLVLKWYLSSWFIAPKAVKKPLNPVLGEYFTSYWNLSNGHSAYYISEQTSHHPPKSSYFYMIPESNIRVDGTVIPKSKFLGNSTAAMMEGLSILRFLDIKTNTNKNANTNTNTNPEENKILLENQIEEDSNPNKSAQVDYEYYTLTQPNMYARGLLFGKLKLELGDHMIVKCPSSNLVADIEFKTKGFISGTYDSIQGYVKDLSKNINLFELSGKWNDQIFIKNLSSSLNLFSPPSNELFFDVHSSVLYPPLVRPLSDQGEFESKKLWNKVIIALNKRNHDLATNEKFKIEDNQRLLAKKRIQDGVEFHPKLFKKNPNYNPTDTSASSLSSTTDLNLSDPLEFILYKNIPINDSPENKIKAILSVAPILPGQSFTPEFEIPTYKKPQLS
ncbi:oxysterol-binding protein OSH6 [Ascoidea rubescens DSM 1968]|uniref:Oxysterol-binding protein n=1 Tax=Ascoidea rubescens DSM 1968 TaxID=1344418 RepID=A0A1D2VR06_9ASCO|nr:Oxysterol-binding protein [Ascoidea rubescens DSM 1968]ODV64030.1 Oxysterol-binding protein [Ascoidea rubescens DSM 1968]